MSDSLLVEALADARALLGDLDDDDDVATASLRARVDVLDRAVGALELRPALRESVVCLAKLAIQLRDEAVALRTRHRSVHALVRQMMD